MTTLAYLMKDLNANYSDDMEMSGKFLLIFMYFAKTSKSYKHLQEF